MAKRDEDLDFDDDFLDDEQDQQDNSDDDFKDDFNDDFSDDFGLDGGLGGDMSPAMEKHADLLKGLTSFHPFLKDKVNGWLGLVWDEEAGKHVRSPHIEPIMNERCAAWCVDYLKTYTRDNNIITNIGRREYEQLVGDIIEVIWLNIGTRSEEFGIKNNGDILKVCVELEHAAELVLMGAGDGKYNKLLTEVTNRTENISGNVLPMQQMQPQPMGLQQPLTGQNGFLGKMKKAFTGG